MLNFTVIFPCRRKLSATYCLYTEQVATGRVSEGLVEPRNSKADTRLNQPNAKRRRQNHPLSSPRRRAGGPSSNHYRSGRGLLPAQESIQRAPTNWGSDVGRARALRTLGTRMPYRRIISMDFTGTTYITKLT